MDKGWRILTNNGENPEVPAGGESQLLIRDAPLTVERTWNHVYYYAPVNRDRCLSLIKNLRSVADDLIAERLARSIPEDYPRIPIWLHIQSYGGGVFPAFGIADQLSDIKAPIYSIVEGVVASAATIISMACAKRFIHPSSFMLIHQISSVFWGNYSELEDQKHLLDMLMGRMVSFYKERSSMKVAKIKELLKRDSWFNAKECVELGLVDGILNE